MRKNRKDNNTKEYERSSPEVMCREVVYSSPWMALIEKQVKLIPEKNAELFYCITQAPYVSILAQTPDGRIPLVRQFRPCVEEYTWEFPGGTLDAGETAEVAARRELLEEAGLNVLKIKYLGNFYPDTGRLQIDSHAFYAKTTDVNEAFVPEKGMTVKYVTPKTLRQMILTGEFKPQLHLAILAVVGLHGIDLDVFDARSNHQKNTSAIESKRT